MASQHHLFQRPCAKCGAPLAFITTAEGKRIPLDLRAPVYGVVDFKRGTVTVQEAVRTHMSFVSHFATCPSANEFSGSNRKEKVGGTD